MITFQRSISFAGDTAAVPTVHVTIDVAGYTYRLGEEAVTRVATTPGVSTTFEHSTAETTYKAGIPDDALLGDTPEARALAVAYYIGAIQRSGLAALDVPISVTYRAEGQVLGSENFAVLMIPFSRSGSRAERTTFEAAVAQPRPPRTDPLLLARTAVYSLLKDLNDVEERLVLMVVMACTKLTDGTPSFDGSAADALGTVFEQEGLTSARGDELVQAVKAAHSSLFDIVLEIPAPRTMVVKGDLTVAAPAGTTVDASHFGDFVLTAEWADASSPSNKRSFTFSDTATVDDGTSAFDITGSETLYASAVRGEVAVNVRGLDPSSLWSRSFAPDDPQLASLDITVPMQVRTTYTVPDAPPRDPNLRLRGRVVVLHRNCAVKDVLVLVKAKTTEDGDWQVVGAATADAAGNFSIPYPYGTYVAAQASCSVAPRATTTIPIVAETGDRTISDAFLFLLVENTLVPDEPCEEETCGCGKTDEPGRLPDFEDLVGSDVYSQDLGTGCINLNKPNRTINEYPFQAIVRTSDPDVASYALSRHEAGLDEIDIAQVASLNAAAQSLAARMNDALTEARKPQPDDSELRRIQREAADKAFLHAVAIRAAVPSVILISVSPATLAAIDADVAKIIEAVESARNQLAADGRALQTQSAAVLEEALRLKETLAGANAIDPFFRMRLSNRAGTLLQLATVAQQAAQQITADDPAAGILTPVPARPAREHPGAHRCDRSQPGCRRTACDADRPRRRPQPPHGSGGHPADRARPAGSRWSRWPSGRDRRRERGARTATAGRQRHRHRRHVGPLRARRRHPSRGPARRSGCTTPSSGSKGRSSPPPSASSLGGSLIQMVAVNLLQPTGSEIPDLTDATAQFAQAVSVATGHILHYKVEFKADGYSLGDLVYSLPLAPGQKKESWSSTPPRPWPARRPSRSPRTSASPSGWSTSATSPAGWPAASASPCAAARPPTPPASVQASAPAARDPAVARATAAPAAPYSASRAGSPRPGARPSRTPPATSPSSSARSCASRCMQNAEGYRSLNASVVTTVQQGQRYGVTSEVIANHNHCHSLTMMYFEVLRHYAIFQNLSSVEECVFVPLLLARFSEENIAAWRDVLAPALLPMPSETYLQPFVQMAGSVREHPLHQGASTPPSGCAPATPTWTCPPEPSTRSRSGSPRAACSCASMLPRPKTRYDRIKSLPVVNRVQTQSPMSAIKTTQHRGDPRRSHRRTLRCCSPAPGAWMSTKDGAGQGGDLRRLHEHGRQLRERAAGPVHAGQRTSGRSH